MLSDIEVQLQAKITALENMQEARRANWHAEEAGRIAKIDALKAQLKARRDRPLLIAAEKAAAAAESERQRLAWYAKQGRVAPPMALPPLPLPV